MGKGRGRLKHGRRMTQRYTLDADTLVYRDVSPLFDLVEQGGAGFAAGVEFYIR